MSGSLDGRLALVTGGSRGLGLAIVESLLARGDRVATFSRSGSPALSALAAAHPDQLHIDQLDAADSPAIQAFVNRVAVRFGRVDHCIANHIFHGWKNVASRYRRERDFRK